MILERIENGPFFVNTFIVGCKETRRGIVIDPGHETDRILAAMRASELTFDAIVNTHGHVDHVAGVAEVKRAMDLPFQMERQDEIFLDALEETCRQYGLPPIEQPEVDEYLEAGGALRVGNLEAKLLAAPGHSPGSLVLDFGAEMISGDVIFLGSIGRTDLPHGDLPTLLQSIRREILTKDDAVVLHPGHGPKTTVGNERATNPFLNLVNE